MVIIFQSEKAFNHLKKKGKIYTFRKKQRKKLGKDWVTRRRGGKKEFNALIIEVGETEVKDLGKYVSESGFKNLKEWKKEIEKLNKGKIPQKGFLYLVKKEVKK